MQNKTILKELICLNGGESNIAYAESNMWFSENPKYAAFVAELKENIRNNDVRGSILIATDREVIWASGSRSVDVNGDTVTPLSTYEIGSLTKMYTAAIIFKLIDEGKLKLTNRVSTYFPEYYKAEGMTVFDLLHMRSGMVDFANDCKTFFNNDEALMNAFDNGEITDEVFLEHLYTLDLTFAPNSKMQYCNTNYVLLAMIIERITGKSYKKNVRERIFEPLGMNCSSATTCGDVTSVPEGKAGMLDFVDNYGCGWGMFPQNADMMFHDGDTNSYSAVDVVFHASDAEKRCYFLMMSCCNGNDEHEEENDETAEAENDETEDNDKEVKFDQYQLVFDLCQKFLQ